MEGDFEKLFKPANTLLNAIPTPLRVQKNTATSPTAVTVTYSFPPSDLHGSLNFFLSVIRHTHSVLQVARNLYFHGNGKWLVGIVDGLIAVIVFDLSSFSEWLSNKKNEINVTAQPDHLWAEAMDCVVQYSVAFELNRSHNWVQVCSDECTSVITMTVGDVLTADPRSQPQHRNVAVLKIHRNPTIVGGSIIFETLVHKYYPINLDEIVPNSDHHVVTMPSLIDGMATLTPRRTKAPRQLETALGIREYWWNYHGYLLPDIAAMNTLTVTISQRELTYPSVCVWKHLWSLLPNHTREFLPNMHARLRKELAAIVSTWNKSSNRDILLEADKFSLMNVSMHLSDQNHTQQPLPSDQRYKRKPK